MKRGWEGVRLWGCEGVPLMWKAKVELIEIWLPQPELFLHYLSAAGDGWTVPVTRFLTKRPWFPRSWLRVTTNWNDDLLKTGVQIRVRLVVFAKLQAERDEWRYVRTNRPPRDSEQSQLLRKEFGLREKKRLFWIKEIRPFDLREGASSICARTRLRPLSVSSFASFYRGMNFASHHTWIAINTLSRKHSLRTSAHLIFPISSCTSATYSFLSFSFLFSNLNLSELFLLNTF